MNTNFLSLQLRASSAATTNVRAAAGRPQPQQQAPKEPVPAGPLRVSSQPSQQTDYKVGSISAPTTCPPSQSKFESGNFVDSLATGPRGATKVVAKQIIQTTLDISLENKKKKKKKRNYSLFKLTAALFCDALESAAVEIAKLQNYEKPILYGNFAPVESEFGPSECLVVKGTLPSCLNGEFIRVGPNPKFEAKGNYSWFDGDGMLHGLRIKNGQVSYTCRYVRTARLSQEEHYGAAKFMRTGDCLGRKGLFWALLHILRVRLGVLDISDGSGTANTALVFHNRELLCLQETDKPYSIRVHDDGNLETIGRVSYDRKLNHPFTAHPKVDPETGEMFVVGSNLLGKKPFVTYRVVSKGGEMRDPVAIGTSGVEPRMMHDMAITEHYTVFLDCPLYFNPLDMVFKDQGVFCFDKSKSTRFGILPRYAGDDSSIRWFELPACMIVHTANAWEQGEEVVLIACRSPSFTLNDVDELINNNSNGLTQEEELVSDLYEFRFSLRTGEASLKQLGDFHIDFPVINRLFQGRRNRYVYTTIISSGRSTPIIKGIAKFDLMKEPEIGKGKLEPQGPQGRTNLAGVFWFGEGRGGSEVAFVASGSGSEEDDGYLLCYVYDENEGKSEAVVIDARTMSADPVAIIELPARVPYGFHGLFVSEQQLEEQGGFQSNYHLPTMACNSS